MSAIDETDGETGAETEPGTGGASGGLSDHQYFQRIEEVFIGLRGAPLLLSPKDWQTAREWHRQGIPLELVTRTLEEVFERLREREDDDTVSSLRYCNRAVQAAWKELRELTAVAGGPADGGASGAAGFDPAARLSTLAAALPRELPGREDLAERLAAIAEATGAGGPAADPRRIETELAELDRHVIEALVDGLEPGKRRELEAAAEASVRFLADRVPADELDRARRRVLEQKVRRLFALPTLSLFAPEAESET